MRQQQAVVALLLDRLADHDARRGLRERDAGCLRREGHGARRARVRLDDVERVRHERVLHVDQALHAAALGDRERRLAQTADLVVAQRAWRQRARRIAGVDAGLLDVFHDAADVQLVAVEQCVDVDLDRILQELVDEQRRGQASGDDRVGLRLVERAVDVLLKLGVVVNDLHAASAEHVARAHEHRVADVVRGVERLAEAERGAEARRVELLGAQHLTEELAVLGQVDRFGGRAEDRHAGGLEPRGERQRRLAAELHDNALDRAHLLLGFVDLEDVLEGQRLEVEAVGHVVVGRDGLRVAVDHDRVIVLAELLHRVHAGVVELDALADAVGAGSEDDDGLAVAAAQLGLVGVARIVVRRGRVELGSAGVDGLVDRVQAVVPAQFADRVLAGVAQAAQMRDLQVGQARELRLLEQARRQRLGGAHLHRHVVDARELTDEPRVDLRRLEDLLLGGAAPDRAHQLQVAVLGRRAHRLEQLGDPVGGRLVAVPREGHVALVDRTHRLAERFLEVAGERHRLADRLHRRRQRRVGARELLEREARHLRDDVVDRRLEARRRRLRDVVLDLVERVAERELRRDLRDREAGGLRRERRRARDARVHLDDDDAAGLRVDRELNVAAAGVDADAADDRDADVAQLLVFAVGEREHRGDGDRVAGVHADRVDVLDRADDHDVVVAVAHQLELVFLPALDALLDEHLVGRRIMDAGTGDAVQLLGVVRDAGAEAAHRERRAHDEREPEAFGDRIDLLERVRDVGARRLGAGLLDDLLERFAVLTAVDRLERGADELDVVLLEHAGLAERDGRVERGLSAERRQQRVGALLGDDAFEDRRGDRLDVGGVGHLRVGHDRGRVGVDEDDADALLAQDAAGLGSRIVELGGLTDDDRAGADDHHRLDVVTLGHSWIPPWHSWRWRRSSSRRSGRTDRRRRAGRRRPPDGTGRRRRGCRRTAGLRRRRR